VLTLPTRDFALVVDPLCLEESLFTYLYGALTLVTDLAGLNPPINVHLIFPLYLRVGRAPARALVELTPGGWKPKPEAPHGVRELRDRCLAAGVAFFHKQWGGPRPTSGGRLLDGCAWSAYPAYAPPGAPGPKTP